MEALTIDPAHSSRWPSARTPYEADALTFCRDWLAGQQIVTLHTSGSTGTPKSIQLTRAQMRASAHLTGKTLDLKPTDRALVCLNIHYVAGVMMLVRGLELGLPMTLVEPSGNPLERFSPVSEPFRFTALVPLQLQTILEKTPEKLPLLNAMKAILVGGAATSRGLEKALQVVSAPVYATYGMTETVSHIALRRLNGPHATDLFTALDGVQLGTDDRNCLNILSAATNFELVQTNDVVERVAATRFRLLGRADRIINTGGVKVQPEQVEQFIQQSLTKQGISPLPRLFVASLPDERLGQRITLVFETHAILLDATVWAKANQAIRNELGAYAVPKEVRSTPRFVETPTGKIDQKATLDRTEPVEMGY